MKSKLTKRELSLYVMINQLLVKISKEILELDKSDNPQIKLIQAKHESTFEILDDIRNYLSGNETLLKIRLE